MKRFKSILVVPAELDSTDPALTRAVRLAEVNHARLTVVWPIEETNGQIETSKLTEAIVTGVKEQLETAVAPHRGGSLEIDTRVALGRPFIQLISMVLTKSWPSVSTMEMSW